MSYINAIQGWNYTCHFPADVMVFLPSDPLTISEAEETVTLCATLSSITVNTQRDVEVTLATNNGTGKV